MNESLVNHAVRFAVLGLGKIALTRFLPASRQAPGVRVVALGTRSPDKIALKTLNVSPQVIVDTYEKVLELDEVEAVYIALPNDLHAEWIERAAAAGKHILCEKPLAATFDQAKSSADACERASVLLAEAFMYRHDPRYSRIKGLIDSGSIGDMRIINATFGYRLEDLENIRLRPERKGGAMRDVGCYGIDVIRFLSATEVATVKALCTQGQHSGVDEISAAILQMENGTLGVVQASTHLARQQQCLIRGSKGNILLPNAFNPPPDQPRMLVLEPEHGDQVVETFPPFDPFEAEIACFADSIRAGRLLYPLENGVTSSAVLESVIDAMTCGVVADLIGSR